MDSLKKRSLFTVLAVAVVLTVLVITSIHSALTFYSFKKSVGKDMELRTKASLLYLKKNIATYIESYAVNEYENLIANEMERRNSFYILVEDYNMGKIVGKNAYLTGKIRDENWQIIDFYPKEEEYLRIKNECFYKESERIFSDKKEYIATVTICLTDDELNKELDAIVVDTLINTFGISALLIIALFVVLRHLFLRPVSDMIAVLEDSDEYGIPRNKFADSSIKEIDLLSQTMNKMVENIEESRSELKAVNENLEKRIEDKLEEIRQKDMIIYEQAKKKALDALLVDLAHQWRQPLNAASLEIQNIEDLLEGGKNDRKIIGQIEIARKELEGLSATISKMALYYETKSSNEAITFQTALNRALEISGKTLSANGITVHTDISDDFNLKAGTEDWLDIIAPCLLNVRDVVKTRNLGEAEIYIKAEKIKDEFVIVFEDNAGGIDQSLLPEKLFYAYTTTHFKSRDKGLGLYIVHSIVTHIFKGEIFATNGKNGAIIEIRIPDARN